MKYQKLNDGETIRKDDIHVATDINSSKFLSISCNSFHIRFLRGQIRVFSSPYSEFTNGKLYEANEYKQSYTKCND